MAVTGNDGRIRLYDTDDFIEGERLAGTSGAPIQISSLRTARASCRPASGEVRIWDISADRAGHHLGNFQVAGNLLDRLVVAADESTAYVTEYTNFGDISSVHRVDIDSGEDNEVLGDVRWYFSTRPLVSPDLSIVATLDDDFVSNLIELPGGDVDSHSSRASPCAHSTRAAERQPSTHSCCATSGDRSRGRRAGSSTSRPATRSSISENTAIYAATFGPPGDDGLPRWAVVVERDLPSPTTVYDLGSGEAVGTFVPDADDFVESLVMSPDGERLAMLMSSGRLIVLDVERIEAGDDQSGAIVFDVLAHTSGSKAIDVSHSGLIATGSSADGLRVWSRDGELLASVPTQQEDPPTFTFAPGTDTLYYEDGGGVVRRFTVDMDDAERLARSVVTRGFTPQECARYFANEPCPAFDL